MCAPAVEGRDGERERKGGRRRERESGRRAEREEEVKSEGEKRAA